MIYKAILNTCQQLAKKATEGMRRILAKTLYAPINQNGIYNKTNIDVTGDGKVITIKTNFPDYTYWVEHGRRPGKQPPAKNLKEWCQRHLRGYKPGMEFAVAKKIGERGTKGKHFMTPLDRMVEMLRKAIPASVRVDIQNTIYTQAKTLEKLNITVKM